MHPLVSILIPAYNAEEFIAEAIGSAIAQTWRRKEIIVVDGGSTDGTLEVVRGFASEGVRLIANERLALPESRDQAFECSQGDYIQWLDADDILAPDKIERQLADAGPGCSRRLLLSSPWASFCYRTTRAHSVPSPLWQDLSPVEWLIRKLGRHDQMQTATWLTSRELASAAGPWDPRLVVDDDGEYFCRVLLASEGVRFVPGTLVYYRVTSTSRASHVGRSDRKKDALALSLKLHVQYLRSLEDSQRVREACLAFLQYYYVTFYPERPDLMAELEALAAELGGHLREPTLRWKYAWMKPLVGFEAAKAAQTTLPPMKAAFVRRWDRAMYRALGDRNPALRSDGK